MQALWKTIEILDMLQPIAKGMGEKDPQSLAVKAIHRNVTDAMAFLMLRAEAVEDVVAKHYRGEYFKNYLKGSMKQTLEEWAQRCYDTSIYKARPESAPKTS